MKKSFGSRLKSLRGTSSQDEIASVFGIKQTTYSGWENDNRKPDLNELCAICGHYGVSADWLLGLSDAPSTNGQEKPQADFKKAVDDFVFFFESLFQLHWTETMAKLSDLDPFTSTSPFWDQESENGFKPWGLYHDFMASYKRLRNRLNTIGASTAESDVVHWRSLALSQQTTIADLTRLAAEGRRAAVPARTGGRTATKTA